MEKQIDEITPSAVGRRKRWKAARVALAAGALAFGGAVWAMMCDYYYCVPSGDVWYCVYVGTGPCPGG